jgi:hypothetical protein
MSKPRVSWPTRIQSLLQTHTAMTVQQLRQVFDGRARSSVFRDLKQLDLITSYSHAGQYHALTSSAHFDQHGLWFFNTIGFAIDGTLKATLPRLISEAEAGMTHKELKTLLRVSVQNTLTELVASDTVGRQLLPNRLYLYVSQDGQKGNDQFQRRVSLQESVGSAVLPPEHIRIEILLEVIRSAPRRVDERTLGVGLRERGVAIEDHDVTGVLLYYDIKKNGL